MMWGYVIHVFQYDHDLGNSLEHFERSDWSSRVSRYIDGDLILPLERSMEVPLNIEGLDVLPNVIIRMYQSGMMSIVRRLKLTDVSDARIASEKIYAQSELNQDAKHIYQQLLKEEGIQPPEPDSYQKFEDYFVVHNPGADIDVEQDAEDVAQILTGDLSPLSQVEIQRSLSNCITGRESEVCHVDWHAMLCQGTPSIRDELLVVEYALGELLRLRLVDGYLGDELVDAQKHQAARLAFRNEIEDLLQQQSAHILQQSRARNPLKLLGDQYLARLYTALTKSFRLKSWTEMIDDKTEVLNTVYSNRTMFRMHRRTEILEWIIIILIAVEIVQSCVGM